MQKSFQTVQTHLSCSYISNIYIIQTSLLGQTSFTFIQTIFQFRPLLGKYGSLTFSNIFLANLNGSKSTKTCRSIRSDFEPLTEDEFMSVSDLIRGRSKLADVNQVRTYFSMHGNYSFSFSKSVFT